MKSRSYLGLLTYYAKFLPDVSTVLAPLYQLLKKESQRHWSAKEEKAFNKSKELLTSFKLLVHFDASLLLTLACDASAYGVGAVLPHRMPDGSERPIGYASRTLPAAERNYSQIEKEGLECVFSVKRFHSYLFGHSFEWSQTIGHCCHCSMNTDPPPSRHQPEFDVGRCCWKPMNTPWYFVGLKHTVTLMR